MSSQRLASARARSASRHASMTSGAWSLSDEYLLLRRLRRPVTSAPMMTAPAAILGATHSSPMCLVLCSVGLVVVQHLRDEPERPDQRTGAEPGEPGSDGGPVNVSRHVGEDQERSGVGDEGKGLDGAREQFRDLEL